MAKKPNLALLGGLGLGLALLFARRTDDEGEATNGGTNGGGNGGGGDSNGSTTGNGGASSGNGWLGTVATLPGPSPYDASCNPPESAYDAAYWDGTQLAGGQAAWRDAHFDRLGYDAPGAGASADESANRVLAFQRDYNRVSQSAFSQNFETFLGGQMGLLVEDGQLTPCTLNALRFAVEVYGGMNSNNDIATDWGQSVATATQQAAAALS